MVPAPTAVALGARRVLTIPNLISFARLACLPVIVWMILGLHNREGSAWFLGALGATDWVDGYIARHTGQVSELGKVLDPTADRLLFILAGGAILVDGSVPWVIGLLVLAREVVVGGTLVLLTLLGMKRFDVKWVGKAGTLCLMFAFPLFLNAESTAGWAALSRVLAWMFTVPGLLLSYYAAFTYIPLMRHALHEGREARKR